MDTCPIGKKNKKPEVIVYEGSLKVSDVLKHIYIRYMYILNIGYIIYRL